MQLFTIHATAPEMETALEEIDLGLPDGLPIELDRQVLLFCQTQTSTCVTCRT